MFSKNNKISKRQVFRLLSYDLLGIGTLLLPAALAEKTEKNGLLSICIGIAAGVIFSILIGWVINSMAERESYPSYLKRCFGRLFGTVLLLGYIVYYLCLGGYSSYVFGHLIVTDLLKEQSFYWIVIGILALAVYGIFQGIEGRARVYEILFWFLLLPLFLMLFLGARDVKIHRLFPIYSRNGVGILNGSYLTFVIFSLGGFSLFLVPFAKEKNKLCNACVKAVLFCGVVFLVLYGILQGIFGTNSLAKLEYPAVTLMSMIQIPGGFLQRQDAFMVAIWFFTVFALISSSMFYASDIMKQLAAGKRERLWIAVAVVLMFCIGVCCYRSVKFTDCLHRFFLMYATPFVILVPLAARLLLFMRKKTKMAASLLMILCTTFLLGGCSTTELENRNFPLAMGIDEDDDFCRISYKFQNLSAIADEKATVSSGTDFYIRDKDFFTAISKYANDSNKILDYNHMKAIVLSEDYVEDMDSLNEFLQVCEKEELIARNTLLFFAEDAGEILALDKNLDAAIGTYLEELIESREDYKLKDAVTLGDLLNDTVNKEQLLLVPVLTAEGNLPAIRNYYAISGGVPQGEISINEAVLSYLSQGKLKKLAFTLEDGTAVTMNRMKVTGEFSKGKELHYKTKIHLEAAVQKNVSEETEEDAVLKEQIIRKFEEQLTKTAENLQDEPGIDITNSFFKLGMYDREKYEKYQRNMDGYLKDLRYEFDVEIILVN